MIDRMLMATLVALGGIALGCGHAIPARAADEIVIGFATSSTGFMQAYDDNPTKMAQIWMDEINAKGGLLGRKLKAVFADAKSDRVEAVKAAQAVLSQGAELVVGSCDYDFGAPAVLEGQKAGKVSVFVCAEDPKAGIMLPYSFSASVVAQAEGIAMAVWGYDKKSMRSAYVLQDDGGGIEYFKSVCGGFEWMFPKKGGTIAGRDTFPGGDPSVASQVTKLKQAIANGKVDAIMMCSSPEQGTGALRQIRAAGIELPVLGDTGFDGNYWLSGVPNLGNFYTPVNASIFGDDPRPEVKSLISRYQAKFGQPPGTSFAFPIYAWLELWGKAVTQANTPEAGKVVAIMNAFRDEMTTLGPRTFTPNFHMQESMPLFIVEISNGQGKIIDKVYDREPIPKQVLFRTAR